MAERKFQLRPARPSEVEALSQLCLRSKAQHEYDAEFMELCREALTLTEQRLELHPTRVAVDPEGTLLGVAAYSVEARAHGVKIEVELLFVEPSAMGCGLGRALLGEMKSELVSLGHSRLWILSDPEAEAFYLKQGAVRIELRPSDCIPDRLLPWLRLELCPPS